MDPTAVARSRNRSSRRLRQKSSSAGELFATPPESPSNNTSMSTANNDTPPDSNTAATFLDAHELQERIQAERERVTTKRDRLVQSRQQYAEEESLFQQQQESSVRFSDSLSTPGSTPVMSPQEAVFSNPPPGESMFLLEENSEGWIDAQSQHSNMNSIDLRATNDDFHRMSTMSEHRGQSTSTKIQPISTKKRPTRRARPLMTQKCRIVLLLTFVFLLVGGAIAAVVILVFSNQNDALPTLAPTAPAPCLAETNILPECSCVDEIPDDKSMGDEVFFNRALVMDFLQQSGIVFDDDLSPFSCHVTNQALLYVSDLNHHVSVPPTNLAIFQRYLLAVWYQTLQGDSWRRNEHWLVSNVTECDWFGIHCSDASLRMIGLELNDNDLEGTLPVDVLELLQSVRSVDLSDNSNLDGIIDPILTSLPLLERLDISRTHLGNSNDDILSWSSSLLQEFVASDANLTAKMSVPSAARELRIWDVSHNALTGTMPASLDAWPLLSVWDVSDNQLTGALPTSATFSLQHLTTFLVHENPNLSSTTIPSQPYSTALSFVNFGVASGNVSSVYCTDLPYLDSLVVSCNNAYIANCPCCQCADDEDV